MSYTYTIPNTISSGSYILSNGSNGIDWSTLNSTISVSSNSTHNTLEVKGEANFDGDIKVKGKSITDSLERIEERLAILRPNEELEEKWENLRALRNAYMELEKEILEKQEMWAILKK
jgi:hypothetical protein